LKNLNRFEYIKEKTLVDKVLNLSAFGELIDDPNKDMEDYTFHSFKKNMGEPEQNTGLAKVNHLVNYVLKSTLQIKLLHWQTKSYSEHKALDKLFNSFVDLSDGLVESVMGKHCRPELSEKECNLSVMNYKNPDSPDGVQGYMKSLYKTYAVDCRSLFSNDLEILNQIDEIVSLIDKINYLLTLK
jgi:hypothetical protein